MKAASVNEIKQELKERSKQELIDFCLRLSRYKKENKELLNFLLFEAHNVEGYIQQVKDEIDEGFSNLNITSIFLAKKTLRKVLRIANKHIKYTGSKTAEAEILMQYLTNFRGIKLPWQKAKVTKNIYEAQIKKIAAAIDSMHEDLQYDYLRELDRLRLD